MSNYKTKDDFCTKCRYPIFYLIILSFLIMFYVFDKTELDFKSVRRMPSLKMNPNEGFSIKTSGCRIPILDPFDATILKYLYKPKHYKCSTKPPLISSNLTSIFVEHEALVHYHIDFIENLTCCYQPFWRVDTQSGISDNIYAYGACETFHDSVNIDEEFVKIMCVTNNNFIYKDFHSFVIEKRTDEVFSRKIDLIQMGTDKLNLLMIGLDSISRSNFQRQMPNTAEYLKEELNAYEFIGYNKVGDNTFPNLIPILTGLSEKELTRLCWQTQNKNFDDCPFIWKDFSEKGYLTSFAEDASWMGMFNYLKNGFKQQPTDYYWKTFNYIAEREIGHKQMYNAHLCIGTRPTYVVMLEYIEKLIESMGDKPFFSFFWGSSLSHDNLNFPSMSDNRYKKLFKSLHDTNTLNQTVLIVLSDHGMRWGGIRSTYQGQLEERLPFLFLIFPPWFQAKYSAAIANLRKNKWRLTTPYDLHKTLVDILNLPNILPNKIKERTNYDTANRGISLFLHIPENRTCSIAGIAAHWCTCQKSTEVNRTNSIVIKIANFIVNHTNSLLEGYKACSILTLDEIVDARLFTADVYLKNNLQIHDYTLMIKTRPGGGLFEATVRSIFNANDPNETYPFQLTGTISRINLYGKQSYCVTDFHLKLYCYCGG